MLKKIVYAGSNNPSFQRASQDLLVLAEVSVAAKQVERLTEQIGAERCAERDAAVAAYLAQPLTRREEVPPEVTPPPVAVVEMDGGRLQIRTAAASDETTPTGTPAPPGPVSPPTSPVPSDWGPSTATAPEPDDETDRPAQSKHWREDKVGCLLAMSSTVSEADPCRTFLPFSSIL